jgi:hypothetical protein
MVLTVFADIAEFERSLIRERTQAGRAAAPIDCQNNLAHRLGVSPANAASPRCGTLI